jgi:prepilin-type N-terminal cleavage/methylation domain-containing protein
MTSASIGIRAALQWRLRKRNSRRGFTLLEALVALALLLTFAATLTPLLYQARRIMDNADRRVAADMVLRSVLAAPALPVTPSKTKPQSNKENADKKAAQEDADWATYLVSATVTYAPGRTLSAETVRLGKAE